MASLEVLGRTSKMSPFSKDNLPLFLRRLHSVAGTLPLGAFLLAHLWTNFRLMRGAWASDDAWFQTGTTPLFVVLEVLTVELPLAFHTGYGLVLVAKREPLSSERKSSNSRIADRVSAVVAFGFIVVHLWQFRIPLALGRMRQADYFSVLCAMLSSTTYLGIPLAASFYLVGLAATSYHFAYGLAGLPSTWGVRLPDRWNRWRLGLSAALGIAAFVVGASTVLYFATGSKFPGI